MTDERSLIEWLRVVQIEWGLSLEKLSAITHTSEMVLKFYLDLKVSEAPILPTVPEGLESAVPLISIYRHLSAKYSDTEEQLKWLFTEHKDFGSNKPVEVIAQSPENLSWVSYYLSSEVR